MKKISKRLLSVLCALTLCCALPMTTFAQSTTETSTDVETTSDELVVTPKSFATLLQVGPIYGFNGHKSYFVRPEAGHHLTVQVNAQGSEITVKAKKKGALLYSSSVTVPPDGSTHTYKMISNCNGGEYEVNFQTNGVATLVAFVSQTQYN